MSKRIPRILLQDILEAANKIKLYTEGYEEKDFYNDSKTIDAVVRNFGIIGEAANKLPDELKKKYTNVDWKRIRGFRDRIVHDYAGVDPEII